MLFLVFFCTEYCTSKLIVVLRCFVSVWRQTANGGTNWKYWFHCFGVVLEVYWLDKISWRNNRWGKISCSLFHSLLLLLVSGIEKCWVPEISDINPFWSEFKQHPNGREGFEGAPRISLDEILVDHFFMEILMPLMIFLWWLWGLICLEIEWHKYSLQGWFCLLLCLEK